MSAVSARSTRVSLWRLERLRFIRTRRWISLLAVYSFFGFLGPITARYASDIVDKLGANGANIVFPKPVPALGIDSYVKNANQIGLILFVVMAAHALSFDSRPAASTFYRTRIRSVRELLTPRIVTPLAAASIAFVVGLVAAWYETVVLIGHLPLIPMVEGLLLEALYLFFAVSVVALAAMVTRTQIATVMLSLGALVALPIMGLVKGVEPWLPSELAGSPASLVSGRGLSDFRRAISVALVLAAALLWYAGARCRRREI